MQVSELVKRISAGDVRAMARAISLIEDETADASELLTVCEIFRGKTIRVGITGPPGAGKSTLVDQMTRQLRQAGRSVGVIAVDPSSPYTGGALLGDRIRMQGFAGDEGVYIRSLASRGAKGGLAKAADGVCAVMEAAGKQIILIETMGVGQDEIDVVRIADVTVLVLVPGMGDDVQSLKAGIMEAVDIYVVNKADCEGADRVTAQLEELHGFGLATGQKEMRPIPILKTAANSGSGVAALIEEITRLAADPELHKYSSGLRLSQDGSLRLDHIGIAVRNIAAARGFYESLGLVVGNEETVASENVRTAMLALGDSRLELIEPLTDDSTIGRFIEKRGEGLHHIAVFTDDLDGKLKELKERGLRLVNDSIGVGAGGHRYFFVHPKSTGGVLVEVVGASAEGTTHNEREIGDR